MTDRLLVRCCCQPTKILGSLPWDSSLAQRFTLSAGSVFDAPIDPGPTPIRQLVLEVHSFSDGNPLRRSRAYKAEGVDVATLRQIPQFVEYGYVRSVEEMYAAARKQVRESVGSPCPDRLFKCTREERLMLVKARGTYGTYDVALDHLTGTESLCGLIIKVVSEEEMCLRSFETNSMRGKSAAGFIVDEAHEVRS